MKSRAAAASLALMLAAGSLAGCAEYTTTGAPADAPTLNAVGESLAPQVDVLNGTSWTISGSAAEGIDLTAYPITAKFASGRLTGAAPVNTYTTAYSVSGEELELGEVATTRRTGTDAANQAEAAFLTLLATVTGFADDGEHLSLLAGEKAVLTFDAEDQTTRELAATTVFAKTLIGKTNDAAKFETENAGYVYRVVSEDGVEKMSTTDLRTDRVNATIVAGKVTKATAG